MIAQKEHETKLLKLLDGYDYENVQAVYPDESLVQNDEHQKNLNQE